MAGRRRKRTRIGVQFNWRAVEMQESPAYRVLILSEHRCLSRLEVELAHHAGNDNGKLPCTYDDFERYGVHRRSIAPSLRTLAALGFIEITEPGRAGNAEWRRPTLFRLTFRHTADADPTDEWRRLDTMEEAETIARAARHPPKKQNPGGGIRTEVQCGNRTANGQVHSGKTATTCISAESATTSISRGGGHEREGMNASLGSSAVRTFAVVRNGTVARIGVRVKMPARRRLDPEGVAA